MDTTKKLFVIIRKKMPELFTGLRVTKEEQEHVVNDFKKNFIEYYIRNRDNQSSTSLVNLFSSTLNEKSPKDPNHRDKVCQIMTPFYSVYSKKSLPFPPRRHKIAKRLLEKEIRTI